MPVLTLAPLVDPLRHFGRCYKIKFGCGPPWFSKVTLTVVCSKQSLVMELEVVTLLKKGTIDRVPPLSWDSGFYSRFFIGPKKDGVCVLL